MVRESESRESNLILGVWEDGPATSGYIPGGLGAGLLKISFDINGFVNNAM